MKYHYFVSYQFNSRDRSGFGQICVITAKEITTMEDTTLLNKLILESSSMYIGVVVLFFQLLRVEA